VLLKIQTNVWYNFPIKGYYGCAIGKAKQAAKTEIEKIKVGGSFLSFDKLIKT
jgi:hypothetical protein